MKKKTLSLIMSATILAAIATGCGKPAATEVTPNTSVEETPATTDAAETPETTEAVTVQDTEEQDENAGTSESEDTIMDRNGNMITLPEKTETIVSMSPSTTQILIDFGLGDSIKAVDTYSAMSFSDELPADILQFDMMEPDTESLIALAPDIVFTTGMSKAHGEDVFASVRNAGVCVADIKSSESFDDIKKDIEFIGYCTGKADEAAKINEEFQQGLDEIKASAEKIPEEEKKTILFELSTPTSDYPTIYTAGTGTYMDEAINLIGAENASGDQASWVSLSEEDAIAKNPDVIISTDTYTPDVVNTLVSLSGWENVDAVKNDQVYLLSLSDEINRPNQHVLSAMLEMARDTYPGYFDSITDPYAE